MLPSSSSRIVSSLSFFPLRFTISMPAMIMPGRAEAALKPVMFAESFLHRVQLAILGDAFDGRHVRAVAGNGQGGAGLDGLAVDVHHACPALAGVAAHVRTGLAQRVTDELDQKRAAFNLSAHLLAIDCHRNCRHPEPPLNNATPG
jgi:hypothetical protein